MDAKSAHLRPTKKRRRQIHKRAGQGDSHHKRAICSSSKQSVGRPDFAPFGSRNCWSGLPGCWRLRRKLRQFASRLRLSVAVLPIFASQLAMMLLARCLLWGSWSARQIWRRCPTDGHVFCVCPSSRKYLPSANACIHQFFMLL
jgi:hypothetical protein